MKNIFRYFIILVFLSVVFSLFLLNLNFVYADAECGVEFCIEGSCSGKKTLDSCSGFGAQQCSECCDLICVAGLCGAECGIDWLSKS